MAMSEHAYFRTDETSISKCTSSNFSIDSILGKQQSENTQEAPIISPTYDSSFVSPHEKMELESENGSNETDFENSSFPTKSELLVQNSFQNNNIRALVPGQPSCVSSNVYSPWFSGFRPPALIFGLQGILYNIEFHHLHSHHLTFCFLSFSSKTYWKKSEKTRIRQKTKTGIQCKTIRSTRGRVQGTQKFSIIQTFHF